MHTPFSYLSLGYPVLLSSSEPRGSLAPSRAIIRALLASATAGLLCIATSTASAMNLTVEDSGYAAACLPAQWRHTEEQLRVSAKVNVDALVWLVHTYICGTGASAKRVLMQSAPAYVRYVNDSTGETHKAWLVPRGAAVSPRESLAWSANVQNAEGRFPEITVSFHVNEACMHEASMRPVADKWLIVAVADACD